MHIAIDEAACQGHGRCYSIAPDLFDADDEGRGHVVRADVPPEQEPVARSAAASCPERAVLLT